MLPLLDASHILPPLASDHHPQLATPWFADLSKHPPRDSFRSSRRPEGSRGEGGPCRTWEMVGPRVADLPVVTYDDLAAEYYDLVRHPTCANFLMASDLVLRNWLPAWSREGWCCEIGPGRSLVAKQLLERGQPVNRLVLVDVSPRMLGHSKHWAARGAPLVVGDALRLPLRSVSVEAVVSSLGDPYNGRAYWREISRVLRPGGLSLFTTPSYEWARAFRGGGDPEAMEWAEFEMRESRRVRVRSWILPSSEQRALIEESGLVVRHVMSIPISALTGQRLSTKLILERGPSASVVTGYFAIKPDEARW